MFKRSVKIKNALQVKNRHYVFNKTKPEINKQGVHQPYCFYVGGKWKEDIAYLTDQGMINELYSCGRKQKLTRHETPNLID